MPAYPHLVRLLVTPDEPEGFPEQRTAKSRRPHGNARHAAVKKLIEETPLTYGEIAKRTGVGRATICRWTQDGGWKRHAFAPRATDTVPRPRAGQKLKLRLLAERLRALAERYVRELEDAPKVEVEKLMQALEVLKMARAEALGRNRRRRRWPLEAQTGQEWISRQDAIKTALKEIRSHGANPDRAPQEAVDLVIDANAPAEDHMAFHGRGNRRRR